MRVLIAGCGYVGSALAARLVVAGHEVHGLRRNVDALPTGVRGVAADLTDRSTLTQLPTVDALVYCAAANGRSEASYEAAYVRGVENVLDALGDAPLARAVFTSSTAVYAQDDGSDVDEGSPTEPSGFSGRILLRAERRFLERTRDAGVVLPATTTVDGADLKRALVVAPPAVHGSAWARRLGDFHLEVPPPPVRPRET